MDIIKKERKGKHLDTLEKFHIFCSYKRNKPLNDNNIDTYNPIFNTIYKQNDTNTIEQTNSSHDLTYTEHVIHTQPL
jgi:hypothetical protein